MQKLAWCGLGLVLVVVGEGTVEAEPARPGKQVAMSLEVPLSLNIWVREKGKKETSEKGKKGAPEEKKKETPEQVAKRQLRLLGDKVDPTRTELLRYWLYLPEDYDEQSKCPLVLFLHGAGERGDDLELVKKHGPPKLLEERDDCPAIVVSPQCPTDRFWSPTQLSKLLDHCEATWKVDVDRVYVTGLSMGGFGTWALTAKEPERFAAAIPICGGGNVKTADRLIDLPIWVFHGAKDPTVAVERTEEMVRAIRAAGGEKIQWTIYPEAKHDSWTKTYANDDVAAWLFDQKRTR